MITKIGAVPQIGSMRTNSAFSFTGRNYNTICEDIDIDGEKVSTPVKSVSGDINIDDSILNKGMSSVSGDIAILESSVKGDVVSTSGDIKIFDKSQVRGDVKTISGDIKINNSSVSGDVNSVSGKISLKDTIVDGLIKTTPDNLNLKGENSIRDLVIKSSEPSVIIKDCRLGNVFIHSNNVFTTSSTIIINGQDITKGFSKDNVKKVNQKTVEFVLPRGNKILNMLKFDTNKPGVLILEKGAEFLGKLVNGTIKRI